MRCWGATELPEVVYNRWTRQPLHFKRKQLEKLHTDFVSVALHGSHIDASSFRQNMGILGVESTLSFCDRLFASFDLDGDGVINLADFLECMEILRYGSFPSKAMLSFRMIANRNGLIRLQEYDQFMQSFLLAWSTLTNHVMTKEMQQRCKHYLADLFRRVLQQTGLQHINFQYFYEVICCRNEFVSALEYIVDGSKQVSFYQTEYIRLAVAIEGLHMRMNLTRHPNGYRQPIYHFEDQLANIARTVESNRARHQSDDLRPAPTTLRSLNNMINKQTGKVVFFGDSNWNLALNMMIGIQMAVKSVLLVDASLSQFEGDWDKKYHFELLPRRFGSSNTAKVCKFVDYAPITFKHIRKLFGINQSLYVKSLGPDRLLASLVVGEISSMTSMISQGKSGAVFYTSSDGKYMIKSVHKRQFKYLQSILRDYFYYLRCYPDTLLSRFFGMHQIREKKKCGDNRYYFVIMANAFNIEERIVEKYDIKGSQRGRYVPPQDSDRTKKDLNFLQRRPIYLSVEDRQYLLQVMYRDSLFLQTHSSLDYSLLIGIIRADGIEQRLNMLSVKLLFNSQIDPSEAEHYIESKVYGSRNTADQRYVFSIIDILTEYAGWKPIESLGNRVLFGDRASAIAPEAYASRFLGFLQARVFL